MALLSVRRLLAGLAVVLGFLLPGAALAQSRPAAVALIADARALPTQALPARAFAGSAVEGRLDANAFGAGRLRLAVPGGRELIAGRAHETSGKFGERTWVGEFEGAPGSLLSITLYRGTVHGFAHHGADTYEIESRPNGRLVLFRVDESRFPPEGEPRAAAATSGDALAATATSTVPATAAEPVVQDILVVYTGAAANAVGGAANLETRIINAVAAANSAYQASAVNVQMNLVRMSQVAYAETGDMSVSLSRLQNTTDGFMDDVHALRSSVGADLVALITNESNYCGIAYLNASASWAFSVTWWNCFAGHTFAHEVGHNQGNSHDRANGNAGSYPYSYGYRTCDHPTLANGQVFRTVMAYSCTGVNRVNYFSNPNILYNGLAPMGIAYETDPANSADNARSMNNRAGTIAGFRTSTFTLPIAPTSLAGTAAGSTQVNLTWTDNASDETGYTLQRATGAGSFVDVATLAANTTAFNNTGLAANTAYSYRVRAFNSAGTSLFSNTVTVTTPGPILPVAPSNLAASNASFDRVTLTWTDNSSDETGFTVERTTDGGTSWTPSPSVGANVTTLTVTGLSPSTTYGFRVRASSAAGFSAYSNVVNQATTAAPPAPLAPAPARVTIAGQTVTVTWANVANESSYELRRETFNAKRGTWSATVTSAGADTTSSAITLSAGTYRYSVRALGVGGSSTWENASCTGATGCAANGWQFTVSGGGGGKPR